MLPAPDNSAEEGCNLSFCLQPRMSRWSFGSGLRRAAASQQAQDRQITARLCLARVKSRWPR